MLRKYELLFWTTTLTSSQHNQGDFITSIKNSKEKRKSGAQAPQVL